MEVKDTKMRSLLGVTTMDFIRNEQIRGKVKR